MDKELQRADQLSQETDISKPPIPLDATTVLAYLGTKLKGQGENIKRDLVDSGIIDELQDFGAGEIADIDRMLTPEFMAALPHLEGRPDYRGVLRHAMVWSDIDQYFQKAWKKRWCIGATWSPDFWARKYGREKVKQILKSTGITRDGSAASEW